MTPKEQTEVASEQFAAGLANGRANARIVTENFPDGFSKKTGRKLRKITDKARQHVINALAAKGVGSTYIKRFADGFDIGLEEHFSNYERNKQIV